MTQNNELSITRQRLTDKLSIHEEWVSKLRKALEALDTVEQIEDLLSDPTQTMIPGTEDYSRLSATETVLKIVGSRDNPWTMKEIIEEASRGGKCYPHPHSAYNVFFMAAKRLARRNMIDVRKQKGQTFYSRHLSKAVSAIQ